MFRFTIRDVLWLTMVVAMGCGEINHKISVLKQGQRDVKQHASEIDRAVQMTDPDIGRKEQIETDQP